MLPVHAGLGVDQAVQGSIEGTQAIQFADLLLRQGAWHGLAASEENKGVQELTARSHVLEVAVVPHRRQGLLVVLVVPAVFGRQGRE